MIAADTSTWIAYLEGAPGPDTQLLDQALADHRLLMIPPVFTELLSDPLLSPAVLQQLVDVPMIHVEPGYWQRPALLRPKALSNPRKAPLGDPLIPHTSPSRNTPPLT